MNQRRRPFVLGMVPPKLVWSAGDFQLWSVQPWFYFGLQWCQWVLWVCFWAEISWMPSALFWVFPERHCDVTTSTVAWFRSGSCKLGTSCCRCCRRDGAGLGCKDGVVWGKTMSLSCKWVELNGFVENLQHKVWFHANNMNIWWLNGVRKRLMWSFRVGNLCHMFFNLPLRFKSVWSRANSLVLSRLHPLLPVVFVMQRPPLDGGKALTAARALTRWRRMVARKFERAVWHAFGQLLWLVQRPYLRFLPYPYQSTSSPIVWAEQADSMVKSGAYARRHFRRAKINKAFTQVNMHECMQLRNRMGIEHCFVEDPMLTGMMAARSNKGLNLRLRAGVIAEAKAEAKHLKDEKAKVEAVRSLIGPRGGLPTLRDDLLRLATLLHVEIADRDTTEVLKTKIRPVVESLKGPLAEVKSSGSSTEHFEVGTPTAAAKAKSAPKPQPMELPSPVQPEAQMSNEELRALLKEQETKYTTMINQMYQHIMMVQSNAASMMPPLTMGDLPDAQMAPQGWTDEEIQQMNAECQLEMDRQRFEAQHGEFSSMSDALSLISPAEGWDLTQETAPWASPKWVPLWQVSSPANGSWSLKLGRSMWQTGRKLQWPKLRSMMPLKLCGRQKWNPSWMRPSWPTFICPPRLLQLLKFIPILNESWRKHRSVDIALVHPCLWRQAGIFWIQCTDGKPLDGCERTSLIFWFWHFLATFGLCCWDWILQKILKLTMRKALLSSVLHCCLLKSKSGMAVTTF